MRPCGMALTTSTNLFLDLRHKPINQLFVQRCDQKCTFSDCAGLPQQFLADTEERALFAPRGYLPNSLPMLLGP